MNNMVCMWTALNAVQSKTSSRASVPKPFHQVCTVVVSGRSAPVVLEVVIQVEMWQSYKYVLRILDNCTSRDIPDQVPDYSCSST